MITMETICVKYLKPMSAAATFLMIFATIYLVWTADDEATFKIVWIKCFISYCAWMIGNFIIFKVYNPYPYLRAYINTELEAQANKALKASNLENIKSKNSDN